MKVICVDDEDLVLQLTLSLCREIPMVSQAEGFRRPGDALARLKNDPADVAILDINMPEMDGLALAARIKEVCPDISIIFLTGYSEYAVEAFAMHASGYLLKPVSRERLADELAYAAKKNHLQPQAHIQVSTFGEFDIRVDGVIVNFSRSRAKELLAYLVDRQGNSVTRVNAFSALWEDAEYDRAMQKQLDVVIRSLRNTLEEYGISEIFEMHKGVMRICPEMLDCDLYHFLAGDIDAVNSFRGEYMSSYAWASLTEAYMDRVNTNT
ncbi:MAG: response regulator [Blautia sp.]|nr:response regulator [Blautia sp.]